MRGQDLGGGLRRVQRRAPRVEVHGQGGDRICRASGGDRAEAQSARPREVAGDERQDDQGEVAPEALALEPGHSRLDRNCGGDREAKRRQQVPADAGGVRAVGSGQDELLPQSFGVLTGELARDLVDTAHPLDRDQERLVGGQAGVGEVVDLPAQVVFHLGDVGRRDRLAALDVLAPLADLVVEFGRVAGHCASPGCIGVRPRHTCSRASATTSHCWRRSASASRPERVKRVVLALAPGLGRAPGRLDVTLSLQPVQERVEHAVGPRHLPAGQLPDPLENRVAVRLAVGEDAEHERRRRRGDEVLVDVHALPATATSHT